MKKPEPVVITTICSLCDQPWEAHGNKPTTEDCIRLLKIELTKRPTITIAQPIVYPPYVVPYRPSWPYGTYTVQAGGTAGASGAISASSSGTGNIVEFKRPDDPPDSVPVAI